MGARLMFSTMAFVLGFTLLASVTGCSTPAGPATPITYGYAWAEQEQLDLHESCMASILKDAPRDATLIELNKWLYECKRDNGNSAF